MSFFRTINGTLMRGGVASWAISGAPVNGASGTGANKAGPGSSVFDYVSGVRWVNVGTKASPVWSPMMPITFNVTSANILAMFGAPVNLIAAPPAGYSVIGDNVLFIMTRTGTAYANGGAVSLVYTGGAVAIHTGSMPAAIVTTGGAGTALNQNGGPSAANGIVVPTATGVDITNATAAFITGTGTMKVVVEYRVVKQ